jgi:hypothetical protein
MRYALLPYWTTLWWHASTSGIPLMRCGRAPCVPAVPDTAQTAVLRVPCRRTRVRHRRRLHAGLCAAGEACDRRWTARHHRDAAGHRSGRVLAGRASLLLTRAPRTDGLVRVRQDAHWPRGWGQCHAGDAAEPHARAHARRLHPCATRPPPSLGRRHGGRSVHTGRCAGPHGASALRWR